MQKKWFYQVQRGFCRVEGKRFKAEGFEAQTLLNKPDSSGKPSIFHRDLKRIAGLQSL